VASCNAILKNPEPVMRDAGDSGIAELTDGTSGAADTREENFGTLDASLPEVADAPVGDASEEETSPPLLLTGSPDAFVGLKSLAGLTVSGDTLYGTNRYPAFALVYRTSASTPTAAPERFFVADRDAAANAWTQSIVSDTSHVFFAVWSRSGLAAGIYSVDLRGDGGLLLGGDSGSIAAADYLALDLHYLYWASPGLAAIGRANKDGTNAVEVNVGRTEGRIAAAGGLVYFLTAYGLFAVSPADMSNPLSTNYSGSTRVDDFDVGPQDIVWVDLAAHKIYRNATASPGAPRDITPPGISFTRGSAQIRTDGTLIYLFNFDESSGATIFRFGMDGSSPRVVASLDDSIAGITQDSRAVYFATYGRGLPQGSTVYPPPFSAVWKLTK
jgi:hypothetical protein